MGTKKIIEVQYNFSPGVTTVHQGHELIEQYYESVNVHHPDIVSITEHLPQGDGDRYYCDVEYANNTTMRIFNPNIIIYEKEEK